MSGTPTEPEMLSRLIEGLKQAAGSAHQLAHAQRNPNWLTVRNMLEAAVNQCITMATSRPLTEQEVAVALARHEAKQKLVAQ